MKDTEISNIISLYSIVMSFLVQALFLFFMANKSSLIVRENFATRFAKINKLKEVVFEKPITFFEVNCLMKKFIVVQFRQNM